MSEFAATEAARPVDQAPPIPLSNGFGPASDSDIGTRTVRVTFFEDKTAQSLTVADVTLPQLAEGIAAQTGPEKLKLPWLKLAVFGDKVSDAGCLRTNDNVLHVTGIEVEHDAETISFDTAIAVMRKARVRSLLYTSPSHKSGTKERWRILVPLSKDHPPASREKMVARVNGLFGGEIAGESFTLSQAFVFGHVDNPDHRVEVIDGDFLDVKTWKPPRN